MKASHEEETEGYRTTLREKDQSIQVPLTKQNLHGNDMISFS